MGWPSSYGSKADWGSHCARTRRRSRKTQWWHCMDWRGLGVRSCREIESHSCQSRTSWIEFEGWSWLGPPLIHPRNQSLGFCHYVIAIGRRFASTSSLGIVLIRGHPRVLCRPSEFHPSNYGDALGHDLVSLISVVPVGIGYRKICW